MGKGIFVKGFLLAIFLSVGFVHAAEKVYVLENPYMSRTLAVKDGVLSTQQIVNKQARNHHAVTPAIRCGLQGTFRY